MCVCVGVGSIQMTLRYGGCGRILGLLFVWFVLTMKFCAQGAGEEGRMETNDVL